MTVLLAFVFLLLIRVSIIDEYWLATVTYYNDGN